MKHLNLKLAVGIVVVFGVIVYFSFLLSDRETSKPSIRTTVETATGAPAGIRSKKWKKNAGKVRLRTSNIRTEKSDKKEPQPPTTKIGFLAYMKDAGISLNKRMNDVTALALCGDERSIEMLIALGDEKTYLNFAAVRALGSCKGEIVAEYLLEKLSDPDSRVLCEAVRSYAKVRGEEAVSDIVDVIKNNHERSDGFEKEVCTMAVDMLGEIASAEAVPALISELERSEEKGWNLEYGSTVIAALGRIDTSDARNAISEYADRLSARVPEDPLARKYYEDKIKEAQTAAEGR